MDDDILDKIREDFLICEINASKPNASSRKPSMRIKYEKTRIEATVPAYGIRYHLMCLIHEILRRIRLR